MTLHGLPASKVLFGEKVAETANSEPYLTSGRRRANASELDVGLFFDAVTKQSPGDAASWRASLSACLAAALYL
jgi:hypothetical protein